MRPGDAALWNTSDPSPPLPPPFSPRHTYYIYIYATSIKASLVYFAGERVQARPRWCIDNAHPRSRDESDFSPLINSISWHERTTDVIMWSAWKWISSGYSFFLSLNREMSFRCSWFEISILKSNYRVRLFLWYLKKFFSVYYRYYFSFQLLENCYRSTANKFAQIWSIAMNVMYFYVCYW